MTPGQTMNAWMRGGRMPVPSALAGLRDHENRLMFRSHPPAQGETRYYWNGPAGTHPGYVNATAH